MNKIVKISICVMAFMSSLQNVGASERFASPYSRDIHNNGGVYHSFSNIYMEGDWDARTRALEVIFKKEINKVEFVIYKDGVVCLKEQFLQVEPNDYKKYLLAHYGDGTYVVYIKINDIVVVESIVVE